MLSSVEYPLGTAIGTPPRPRGSVSTRNVLSSCFNILIEVLGTIAEQERLTIHQRQREGINAAKAKGKHLGRPSTSLPDNWEEVLALWQSGEITAREAMRRTGMKRTTFYQLVRKSS